MAKKKKKKKKDPNPPIAKGGRYGLQQPSSSATESSRSIPTLKCKKSKTTCGFSIRGRNRAFKRQILRLRSVNNVDLIKSNLHTIGPRGWLSSGVLEKSHATVMDFGDCFYGSIKRNNQSANRRLKKAQAGEFSHVRLLVLVIQLHGHW